MGRILRTRQHRDHAMLKHPMAQLESLWFTRERLNVIFWAIRYVLLLVILAAFTISIVIHLISNGHPSTPDQMLRLILSQ